LVVSLVLVMAVSLLTLAVMQELSLETAMTSNLAARTQAHLSAKSAIETAVASNVWPASGAATHELRLGPDNAYRATVTIRFLGETALSADDPAASTSDSRQYYRIDAEVRGPRNTIEHRSLVLSRVP
jgi:type II secretory pathway pseudopilin PulG